MAAWALPASSSARASADADHLAGPSGGTLEREEDRVGAFYGERLAQGHGPSGKEGSLLRRSRHRPRLLHVLGRVRPWRVRGRPARCPDPLAFAVQDGALLILRRAGTAQPCGFSERGRTAANVRPLIAPRRSAVRARLAPSVFKPFLPRVAARWLCGGQSVELEGWARLLVGLASTSVSDARGASNAGRPSVSYRKAEGPEDGCRRSSSASLTVPWSSPCCLVLGLCQLKRRESFASAAGERDDLLALVTVERLPPGGDRLVAATGGL